MAGQHQHGSQRGHVHRASSSERAILWAAILTGGFMGAELAGGLVANSLTLVADAMHMATDAAALLLALWAFRQARRPATPELTYGRDRMPVLVAFCNALVLLLLTGWIVWEAVARLVEPEPVTASLMLLVAWLGLLVNVAAFLILSRGSKDNLNVRGALLHVLSDLLGSLAGIIAGTVILFTGWTPADPILSLVVSALIIRTTVRLLADSSHVLLQGAPKGATGADVAADLPAAIPGLVRVHHVHVWAVSEERLIATLHAEIEPGRTAREVRAAIRRRLVDRFGVDHATIEVEERPAVRGPA